MGPLQGYRIIEIAGIGPGPFAAMLLADMGAEVIRVERCESGMFDFSQTELDFLNRGKRCIAVNLKSEQGVNIVKDLLMRADGLIEGFRPGVMERFGLGPDDCLAINSKLIYGRMTGWGQTGPMAQTAGHDINYISLAGALHPIGRSGDKPVIPLNLVGDFGGGGQMLAFGMVCALLEAQKSGEGQVVDAAMVDGAAVLMTSLFAAAQTGFWREERGTNMLDSGAHFYEVYETQDGKYMAVGAIEPQFYASLLEKLGLNNDPELPEQFDAQAWPALKQKLESVFKQHPRAYWEKLFQGCDACVTPVLSMSEVAAHPHHKARESFVHSESGVWQPRSAPRYSRTDSPRPEPAVAPGADTMRILQELGYSESQCEQLLSDEVVAQER